MEFFDQVYEPTNPFDGTWANQSFEQCTFRKLDLPNANLQGVSFVNCRFEHCNLTRIGLKNAKLYDVQFHTCRLAHVDFGACNPFGFHADFYDCSLDYTVFLNRNLKKAQFVDCSIREAQFLTCDLTAAVFQNCNLELTRFDANNLTQANLATSYNLEIDPENNRLKKARFSLHSLPGLLTRHGLIIGE